MKTIILGAGKNAHETGLLLDFTRVQKGGMGLEPIMVLLSKESRGFQRIPVSGNLHLSYLAGLPAGLAAVLRRLTDDALIGHLVKKGFAWLQDAEKPFEHLDGRHLPLLEEWIGGVLEELKPLAPLMKQLYYLRKGEPFTPLNIRPASISAFSPSLSFRVGREGGMVSLHTKVLINHESFPLEDFEQLPFFLRSRNEFFLLKKEDRRILAELRERVVSVPERELPGFMSELVKPLAERYPVDAEAVTQVERIDGLPHAKVYVSELNENFLLVRPRWVYGGIEVEEWEGEWVREEGERPKGRKAWEPGAGKNEEEGIGASGERREETGGTEAAVFGEGGEAAAGEMDGVAGWAGQGETGSEGRETGEIGPEESGSSAGLGAGGKKTVEFGEADGAGGRTAGFGDGEEVAEMVLEQEGIVYKIRRRRGAEEVLTNLIRAAHPKFAEQSNGYFYLSFKEALDKGWFLHFYHRLQEEDVPVLGMQHLRKFKYNTHVPKLEVLAGRGIDWFDLTIQVSYGEQVVPLSELRKAILHHQDFILLEDGSLGMLPKEWIEKYELLLKMGQVKEGRLKVSDVHWSLLNELPVVEEDGALREELAEKSRRLEHFNTDRAWSLPAGLQASLRDYQQAGFQWMCLLDDMGWGGCLADDMGLGKTLQTISFLLHLSVRYPGETHLVVCPTSLIYNWENELRKFAPGLAYHIHYGVDRVFDEGVFNSARLILTSYGMVRSDIEHFGRFPFGYIVLDESQAIKNPASQVYKSVLRLKARNRIALSGTPVQNNTFDLYAQMNYLNPGMLGSQEFFREEFANPIDRSGDKLSAMRLRKLVYPFLLRRTKEQVAGDLPDKTEMILWCEMGKEQRTIYDSFKDHYRESILGRIEEEGMGGSSIYILEGLTKLRQICDSPALLKEREDREAGTGGEEGDEEQARRASKKEKEDVNGRLEAEREEGGEERDEAAKIESMRKEGHAEEEGGRISMGKGESMGKKAFAGSGYPNVSTKLEELVREISENTGDHKALVFSQFTSMLGLIRVALEEKGIPYLYLDGSVPAAARKQAVERFQGEEGIRVFLISLKAGGVGLTLTAADYVYLVDPWWNPAAEQQAIDRSHRIGQEKKVFAYKMICKDTVEEKILQLQEKKKMLAADLISDETGFVKKLTKEDINYLFS